MRYQDAYERGVYEDKPLWGLRVLKFDGAIAPRVLKFDSGYAAEGCGGRLMDKPLWGLRVDGPMGRRFLRGLSLTAAMPLRVVVGAYNL